MPAIENSKIMAFIGTDDGADIITRLAKYTDKIYAAVSPRYGQAVFPGGNITVISSYLDEAGIQRWLDRTGAGLIIDSTADSAEDERDRIRKKAEENGLEYLRIKDPVRISRNIRICKSREELLSCFSYSTGNILLEGASLYCLVRESGVEPDRLMALIRPEPEELSRLREAECPENRIISLGMMVHETFWLALFDELKIAHFVMEGGSNRGIAEKISALNHSDAHAYIDGELTVQEGYAPEELWKLLKNRYRLKD